MTSPFKKFEAKAWPHRFAGTMQVSTLVGGTPTDPNVAENWLRSKLADKDDIIRAQVSEVMAERGVGVEEATALVDSNKHLNGFKRDADGLYIEGRQLKAALKEAASVAVASGKLDARGWGKTNKGLLGFLAEHVCVVEDRLHLNVTEPTGVLQRFVHTFRGSGIQYEEYVEDAELTFEVRTDHQFTDEQWAMIWLTGQEQGIGASRSQGYGRYRVTRWEPIAAAASRKVLRSA